MRLELTGRHVEITPALRRLIEAKLSKLERKLNDSAVSAQAVLKREKHLRCVEVTLHARGEKFLHGVGGSASWEAAMGEVIDKLSQQAGKVKGKWQERKRRGGGKTTPIIGEEPEAVAVAPVPAPGATKRRERVRMPRILRASRQAMKSMSVADAARAMEAGSDGLVVFRDVETSTVSVLYRRHDGELALVQTEP